MFRPVLFLVVLLVGSTACMATQRKENTVGIFSSEFLGYDKAGILKTCRLKNLTHCEPLSEDNKKFDSRCRDLGHKTFQCSCELVLCNQNIATSDENSDPGRKTLTGFDLNGNKRTCTEKDPLTFCSQSMEPSDEFALRCREAGFESFACGCHDHICSEQLEKN